MLAIRLRRQGAKRSPFYRIVVAEHSNRRDGRFVEIIGHYNPRTRPEQVKLNLDRLAYWQAKGAQLSDTVRTLAVRHKETHAAEPTEASAGAPSQDPAPGAASAMSSEAAAGSVTSEASSATPSTPAEPDEPSAERATP
ncbi:MAG: 30S ribosomal protein S16 [Luteitalea sp.]|nr:30S ribosomal protein S16 [Luteitalea sp.]